MPKTEYATKTSTRQSRAQMVADIGKLAAATGAVFRYCPSNIEPRRTDVVLAFGPCRCSMSFDGASRVGAYLGHWYVDLDAPSDFAPYTSLFALAIGGSNNPYHQRKATTCCPTFELFVASLERGLKFLVVNGVRAEENVS